MPKMFGNQLTGAQLEALVQFPVEPEMRAYLKHPFWQAALLLVLAYIVIAFIIPMLPGSAMVRAASCCSTMATVLVGILIW